MDTDRWERIEGMFESALSLTAPEREDFLARTCQGDAALRAEVEAMLAAASPDHALAIERLAPDDGPIASPPDPAIGAELGRTKGVRATQR